MITYKWLGAIFICLLLTACFKNEPHLDGFNKKAWIADKNGCQSKRAAMVTAIERQKDKLLALDEMEIVNVLGKPDQNELYKRNQKFYYYFINPSPECVGVDTTQSVQLVIRFNAMGLAKEISIK